MKYLKNIEASGACYGIHIGLTMLVAICLAAYDGLAHTYPILMGYLLIGWIIPVALWPFIKKLVSLPVSPFRAAINIYVAPIALIMLGTLAVLLSIFLPASSMNSIKYNEEILKQSDPGFAHAQFLCRVIFGGIGLLFTIIGYLGFYFIRKRRSKDSGQKSGQ
jgi:hypothetical protein